MNTDVSKQDYLKRYLEDGGAEKKRKKKTKSSKSAIPRIKIIDEDISIKSLEMGTKEEEEDDEAPIVAQIIDDRPAEVKAKEIYAASKWKTLGEDCENVSTKSGTSPTKINKKLVKNKTLKSSNRHDSDSDLSPVRVRKRHDSDSDCSPPRQSSDAKTNKRRTQAKQKNSSHPNDSDSDLSPDRPGRPKSDSHKNSDSDLSPERVRRKRLSAKRRDSEDSDLSPPRKGSQLKERNSPSNGENHRPIKTLSGLKAGLQNAKTLRTETKDLRKREREHIKQLDAELSGRHAETIVRDRQTGRKRDIDEELRIDEEKEQKKQQQQQKYTEWGKGIEQTEGKKMKLSEDLYEMSKPLARHCDDEDLENRLKAEIHDDDPMAQYMRKKQQKNSATPVFPKYSGPPPPPNRFQIAPGYRWDGVDRSNGFEKKYFEKHSSRKAAEEEAYLWSVQDM